MKYSIAIVALLGLASVEGVKVTHHHHHHHHHDDNLVALAGDAKPAAPAPAAAAAPAAAPKGDAPKTDFPPENRSNTTFNKESKLSPEKKAPYGEPDVAQKKCAKGSGPLDAFKNCPVTKEE
tara:strand:+ start:103 stop:468 length:366 start_codon:yes stop_codon:yes gene_type:complete